MVEQAASTGEIEEGLSNNPWHNMKGFRKHLRISGTILPKRWLRPYLYDYPTKIDDKQYVIESLSSLKYGLHFIYGSLYLISVGLSLEWAATRFRGGFEPWLILICLVIAIPTHKYGKRLKQDRFEIYNRQTGMIRWEYGWFKHKYREIPFWECEGYLASGANHFGLMRHMLFLQHPRSRGGIMLVEGADYDLPLGFWSFLIQYMDKSKPLPDIPYLKDYPNKEPGLGDWKSWKEKIAKREIVDPYDKWLVELKKHPELDVANYGRDLSQDRKYHNLLVYGPLTVILVTLLLSGLIIGLMMRL